MKDFKDMIGKTYVYMNVKDKKYTVKSVSLCAGSLREMIGTGTHLVSYESDDGQLYTRTLYDFNDRMIPFIEDETINVFPKGAEFLWDTRFYREIDDLLYTYDSDAERWYPSSFHTKSNLVAKIAENNWKSKIVMCGKNHG